MKGFQTAIAAIFLVGIVMLFSMFSERIWGNNAVLLPQADSLLINDSMTVGDFMNVNRLPAKFVLKTFKLQNKKDFKKKLIDIFPETNELKQVYGKNLALFIENSQKDFKKILSKFLLWLGFIIFTIIQLKNHKITAKNRVLYYAIGIVLFGVLYGSDPSPMGTIKDAVVLYGSEHVIFIPRLVAMFIFLLFVVIANKSICAWGCQLGVLQDFIFRLGKNTKEQSTFKQIKVPFVISNTIRVLFFIFMVVFALLWGIDIIHPIDPFKVYHPSVLTIVGALFVGLIVVLSVFIYRPWCTFFCPFGLVGWFFEKLSILKIKVNYDKCIACGKCEKACPSTVMSAILRRDKKVIPDCFSCGACMNVCPTKAIDFESGKRDKPTQNILAKLKKLDKGRK